MKFHKTIGAARRILCALLCLLAFAMPMALATSATPAPTAVPVPDGGAAVVCARYGSHSELILLKDILFKNGYYVSQVTENDLRSPVLDDFTMLAVKEACAKNDLEYQDYGIVPAAWNAIMNGGVKPNAQVYKHIYYMENSESVRRLQAKLQTLGFGADMTPGVYDDSMIRAIDSFCKVNGIAYSQQNEDGISPYLQATLLESSSLKPYSSGAKGFLDKIRAHFTSKANIFGLEIPMLVVWAVCLALLVGCVLLIIHFFVPNDESKNGANVATSRNPNLIGSGELEFLIEYDGRSKKWKCPVDHVVRIGRSVGNFPLDMEDTQISRKHCEIYYNNGSLMLRDYSKNHTIVNGRTNDHGECILSSGDKLQIGSHKITIFF